jgi:hypothetical protein
VDRRIRIVASLAAAFSVVAVAQPARAQDSRPEFVIAAIGDSFSSGEGNPMTPGNHGADGGLTQPGQFPEVWGPTTNAQRCHRSPRAYSGVAADAIQRAHPELKVTFVHVGCSGGSIRRGLLANDDGIDPPGPNFDVPAQIRQLNSFLNRRTGRNRRIDALLVSVGVNDIGFGTIVGHCLNFTEGPCDQNADALSALESGLASLPAGFEMLTDSIAGRSEARLPNEPLAPAPVANLVLPPLRVHLVEYPDPLRDETGALCDGTQTDDELYKNVTLSESTWLGGEVLTPLNRNLQDAAANANVAGSSWSYVPGAVTSFRRHGICAADGERFMLENHEAIRSQGADNDSDPADPAGAWLRNVVLKTSNGTAHPNNAGHVAVAGPVIRALEAQIDDQLEPGRPTMVVRGVTAERTRVTKGGRRLVFPGTVTVRFVAPPKPESSFRMSVRRSRNVAGKRAPATTTVLPATATTHTHAETGLLTFTLRQCTPAGCSPAATLRASNVAPAKLGRPTDLRRDPSQTRPALPGEVDLTRNRTLKVRWTAPRTGTDWSHFRVEFREVRPGGTRGGPITRLTTTPEVTLGDVLNPLDASDSYEVTVRACSELGCSSRQAGPIVETVRTPPSARR